MARKPSEWQKHVAPYVAKAIKEAKKTYKSKTVMTAAQKRQVASLQKKREEINAKIRKMKGK